MGHLLDPATRQPVHLAATTLVGRGPAADWTIPSRLVSTEHARIAWRQGGWSLKDLGSRNGTFVDGQRLGAGQTTWLQPGMQLSFGADRPCFEVVGIDPPVACATSGTGERVEGSFDFLALTEDEPMATVFLDEHDRWVLERDGAQTLASDREVVVLGDASWTLSLPSNVPETLESLGARSLHAARLVFVVSRDEEHVALEARFPGGSVDLDSRAHHHLLLLLARQRLEDAGEPLAERGWLYADRVAAMLGIQESAMNLHVHRARRQLAQAGLSGAAQIVQRRPNTTQMRLGVDAVDVHLG
ncbi:MAG: FHA domain-containing protein [Myxococcales bacterium]|nr:FHA domain-containing protein [Myxococcales bacterium]